MEDMKKEAVRKLLDYSEGASYFQKSIVVIKFLDAKLAKMLNEIELKTNYDSFWSNREYSISHTLLAYCGSKCSWNEQPSKFKHSYDGLFWGNEGAIWKYNRNKDIVKLVDDFFVYVRKTYYPEIKHISYRSVYEDGFEIYNTRYDYLCRLDEELKMTV